MKNDAVDSTFPNGDEAAWIRPFAETEDDHADGREAANDDPPKARPISWLRLISMGLLFMLAVAAVAAGFYAAVIVQVVRDAVK